MIIRLAAAVSLVMFLAASTAVILAADPVDVLEARAKNSRTAAEAVELYDAALAKGDLTPEQRKAAEAKQAQWKLRAKLNMVRVGTDFVDRAESSQRATRVNAILEEADKLRAVDAKLAIDRLKAAIEISDGTVRAQFATALFMATETDQIVDADKLLRACQRIEPENVAVLNNLAVILMRQKKPVDAMALWVKAASLQPDRASLHNFGKFLAMVDAKDIPMTPSALSTAKAAYAKMVLAVDWQDNKNLGWLYSPLEKPEGAAVPMELPMGKYLYFDGIEDPTCVFCGDTGKLRCRNCVNGRVRTGTAQRVTGENPVTGDQFTESVPTYGACPVCQGRVAISCTRCIGKNQPAAWLNSALDPPVRKLPRKR